MQQHDRLAHVDPGAVVFLHELRSRGGQRMLVEIVFSPDPRGGGPMNGRGALTVIAIEPGTWSTDPRWRSGYRNDGAFAVRLSTTNELLEFRALKPGERLRIFAAHADPADASRTIIPYEIAGQRGRLAVEMVDSPGLTFPVKFEMTPLDRMPGTRESSALP